MEQRFWWCKFDCVVERRDIFASKDKGTDSRYVEPSKNMIYYSIYFQAIKTKKIKSVKLALELKDPMK